MKIKLLLSFIFAISSVTYACENSTDKQEIRNIIQVALEDHFQDLKDHSIHIHEFESDAYYLQAKPKISTLFKRKSKHEYIIEINKKLYECSPDKNALEAILVHELEHIQDYHDMNTLELIGLATSYLSKKKRSQYERQTDIKTVKKGYAQGLIDYRKWIYNLLTPKELALKKYYYLTPLEIEDLSFKAH